VYYQWRVVKQWCVLCLGVQALLLLGAFNAIASNFLFPLPQLSFLLIANCLFLFALPALLWFAVKPYILRLQEAKNTKREYLRIKFNQQVFETLLQKQKQITIPVDGLGIQLGNPAAKNTIIKVCNPYCGPCAKAHPKMEKLLEEIPNVKGLIIFTTPSEKDNFTHKPVSHLLAIAAENNAAKTKMALDDWYLADKKDYDVFAKKYPINYEIAKQGSKIESMAKWSKEMNIRFTPTFFLNEYQLPDAYSIEDLQYFLLE
jgi:thiol-disulfide isomerase/thioredoxin